MSRSQVRFTPEALQGLRNCLGRSFHMVLSQTFEVDQAGVFSTAGDGSMAVAYYDDATQATRYLNVENGLVDVGWIRGVPQMHLSHGSDPRDFPNPFPETGAPPPEGGYPTFSQVELDWTPVTAIDVYESAYGGLWGDSALRFRSADADLFVLAADDSVLSCVRFSFWGPAMLRLLSDRRLRTTLEATVAMP